MTMKDKTIAIDWDGTVVLDGQYPHAGEPKENSIEVMKRILDEGGIIIIWTCRSGYEQQVRITETLHKHGIHNFYFNEHVPHIASQFAESSPKVFADIYIDDRGIHNYGREINWYQVEQILFPNA